MMFKRVLLLLLLTVCVVGPSSAAILIDTEYSDYFVKMATVTRNTGTGNAYPPNGIIMSESLSVPEFDSMFAQIPASVVVNYGSLPSSGQAKVNWHVANYAGVAGDFYMSGTWGYFKYTAGGLNYLQIWADFNDPVSQLTGPAYLKCVLQEGETIVWPNVRQGLGEKNGGAASICNSLVTDTSGIKATFGNFDGSLGYYYAYSISGSGVKTYPVLSGTWKNGLRIETLAGNVPRAQIDITKEYDGYLGVSDHYVKFGETVYAVVGGTLDAQYLIPESQYPFSVSIYNAPNDKWYNSTYGEVVGQPQPCTINVYDADTRLPLSGTWDYYVVIQGADAVSGSASGAFKVVNLPVTSILKPHLLYVTKEGYEMTPGFVAIDVPAGGREINIYLTPLETTAPDNSSVVTFSVTDIESGAPVHSALVNVDGVAKYVGASGTAWFILPENTSHDWVVSSPNHWPIGGNFTVGVDDQTIAVSLTRRASDLPRPPLPELPNFPVIHPSLDPAGFRMQILSVPLLGSLASPLLDTVDSLGVGLNDMATAVLDVLTAPADYITGAVSSVGQTLIDTATPYLVTSSLLLQVIGAVISCIPGQVCGLVTFGLLLDIARILLWGPA